MEEMQTPTNASTGNAERSRWYFTKQDLAETPSIKSGIPLEKETSYRQQAANFIQDMGQHLRVTQLCINTAIVYCQRFYMFHSFQRFHRNSIALASLFLAAKVEEQPRKLEHVIKMAHMCLNGKDGQLDIRSETYQEKAQELVTNENILLQTLGFDVAIDHPHTHVVRCCQLVKASKELAQASYYLATNSLHLTTMCLRYSPTIVACFVIHLACKWSNYKIPLSNQNKEWFSYVDSSATLDVLEEMTSEFLLIYEQCPSRLKKKIRASTQAAREDEEHKQLTNACSYSNGASGVTFPAISQHNDNEQRRPSMQSSSRSTSSQLHSAYGSNNKSTSGHSSSGQPSSGHHMQSSSHSGSGHSVTSHGSSSQKSSQAPHAIQQHHSQHPQHHKHHPSAPKDARTHQQSNHNAQTHSRYHSQQVAPHGSSQNSHSSSQSRVSSHLPKPSAHHQQHQQQQQHFEKHSNSQSQHHQSHHSSFRGPSGHHVKTEVSKASSFPSHNDFSVPRQSQSSGGNDTLTNQKPIHGHSVSHPQRSPQFYGLPPKERSIFDIDSPEKPKIDVKPNFSGTIPKLGSGLPPKMAKIPSLFSPPSDSETKPPIYPGGLHQTQQKKSESFLMRDFNVKDEPRTHVEEYKPAMPVKKEPMFEEKHHIQSISKLPMELQSSSGPIITESQDDRREKKHKEKKKKKSKDKEKDRESHSYDGSDRVHKEHKKHKHKNKEKDREKSRDDHSDLYHSPAAGGGLRLKIKLDPEPAALAPIKLNIGKMKNGDVDPARKRSRDDSESGTGPASKMSRVLGTSVETESQFLQNVGSSSSSSHHSIKSSKKFSSR